MEYSAAGNNLEELLRSSPELEAHLQELAEQGADHWALNSRWRTGFNATHIEAYTGHDPTSGNLRGIVYASGHYARYREHGTRFNAAEHVLQDAIDLIENS